MVTKTDHYKNLYKKQKEETARWKTCSESLSKELTQANETLSILGLRLHILHYTPWWKLRTFIRELKKLRS